MDKNIIKSDLNKILFKKNINFDTKKFSKKLKNYIKENNYIIINLNEKKEKKIKDKTEFVGSLLGKQVSQDKKHTKIIEIKPNLKMLRNNNFSLKKNIRYHQSNTGGSLHTDGPQLLKSPNILIMSCISNAKRGGSTLVVDAKKIYNQIKKKKPEIIKELIKNFYFETRGFKSIKDYISKPIFKKKNKEISFRYLKEYIETGYEKAKKNIEHKKIKALNHLGNQLNLKKNKISLKLKKGEIIIIDNKTTAHGRTNFIIDKQYPRKFLRIWIN